MHEIIGYIDFCANENNDQMNFHSSIMEYSLCSIGIVHKHKSSDAGINFLLTHTLDNLIDMTLNCCESKIDLIFKRESRITIIIIDQVDFSTWNKQLNKQ